MNIYTRFFYAMATVMVFGCTVQAQDRTVSPGVEFEKVHLLNETLVLEWKQIPKVEDLTTTWQVQGSRDGKQFKTIGFVWGMQEGSEFLSFKHQLKGGQKNYRQFRVVKMETADKGLASNSVSL